jgi:hypothetical protein
MQLEKLAFVPFLAATATPSQTSLQMIATA